MTKSLKFLLIALGVLIALYIVNSLGQKSRLTTSDSIFQAGRENISGFTIKKGGDSVRLEFDDMWVIVGHDSLEVKEDVINNFLDRSLIVKRGSMVSQNPEKWPTYSVDEVQGTVLRVTDAEGMDAGKAAFGASKSDFSRNYARIGNDPNVYQTDISIIYQLQTKPTYWGQKPAPPDTSVTEP